MIKNLMLVCVIALGAATVSPAFAAEDEILTLQCSAAAIDDDGKFIEYMKADCGSEFAGQCIKANPENAQTYWEIVDKALCDKAAAEQGF